MRTKFADAAQHADAFFVIRAISISELDLRTIQPTLPDSVNVLLQLRTYSQAGTTV